jgi:hypothetical protein
VGNNSRIKPFGERAADDKRIFQTGKKLPSFSQDHIRQNKRVSITDK